MSSVQTVLGPVLAVDLGLVLVHEHLLSLTPGPWLSGGRSEAPAHAHAQSPPQPVGVDALYDHDQVAQAVSALRRLPALGIGTVVDLSPYGVVGRDAEGGNVALLREVSRQAGVHVVTGSSVYLEAFSPEWAVLATIDEMTERFVADATRGIGGTDVRAGVLGEQATGLGEITPHEEKCLRAAARAHRETGLSLFTHTTHGTMALEQIDLLVEEGVDLTRVVMGHMDTHHDNAYVRQVADRGVSIAFDTIGKQYWDFRVAPLPDDMPEGEFTKNAYLRSDRTRAQRIAELIDLGFESQLLLAHDLTGSEVYLNPATHGQWGYGYLSGPFSRLLAEYGVNQRRLDAMMRTNPARLLSID